MSKYIYNPETGEMNVPTHTYDCREYVYFMMNASRVSVHEFAFLFMIGEWPKSLVDHKDTNKRNNRWDNLRLATKSQNGKNRKKMPGKYIGVRKSYKCHVWQWRIKENYIETVKSGYRCPTLAAIARDKYILSIGDEFSTLNVLERKC